MRLLFQGDSITDAGRVFDPYVLGEGYVKMVAEQFAIRRPELKVAFLNRGVSADRVRNLKDRWQEDCLELEPDVVSILVGINDVLSEPFFGEFRSSEDFEADYSKILELTRMKLDAQIVLMEPFLLWVSNDLSPYRSGLDARIGIVRKLSSRFETELVGLDSIFSEATKREKPEFWSVDGVHPTAAGHALIAKSWLDMVE
jgi:lysophospholipase L1-like esterase